MGFIKIVIIVVKTPLVGAASARLNVVVAVFERVEVFCFDDAEHGCGGIKLNVAFDEAALFLKELLPVSTCLLWTVNHIAGCCLEGLGLSVDRDLCFNV